MKFNSWAACRYKPGEPTVYRGLLSNAGTRIDYNVERSVTSRPRNIQSRIANLLGACMAHAQDRVLSLVAHKTN